MTNIIINIVKRQTPKGNDSVELEVDGVLYHALASCFEPTSTPSGVDNIKSIDVEWDDQDEAGKPPKWARQAVKACLKGFYD